MNHEIKALRLKYRRKASAGSTIIKFDNESEAFEDFWQTRVDLIAYDRLPRRNRARYLECVRSNDGKVTPVRWRQTPPASYDLLIDYEKVR
jgi:hypothetical protein